MLESSIKTVRTDMRSLIQDAQELFREATSSSGARAEELRNRGLNLLNAAMDKAQDVQTTIMESGKQFAESADDYVRKNPWRAMAIAAGTGLLIGMMMARGKQ